MYSKDREKLGIHESDVDKRNAISFMLSFYDMINKWIHMNSNHALNIYENT